MIRNKGLKSEVDLYWPDGSRFRRYYANKALAAQVHAVIEASIALGTWQEQKRKFAIGFKDSWTVAEFYEKEFVPEIKARIRSWDRYEASARVLLPMLGNDPLDGFQVSRLDRWVQERARGVSASTVNRDICFAKSLFSCAVRKGILKSSPLSGYRLLRSQEKELKIPALTEYRAVIGTLASPVLRAVVALAGEAGLRRDEIRQLEWANVDLQKREVTVAGLTKSYKTRKVPLSRFAIESLLAVPRKVGEPRVFYRWRKPASLGRIMRRLGMRLHSLRHMRCTQWLLCGVPAPVVQKWLGHSSITTTMRYFRFLPDQAEDAFRRAETIENERLHDARTA